MESNGELKLIIYRLDELTKICQNIDTQMADTIRTNARQDVDINEIGIKAQSVQNEITEVKRDAKWFIGLGTLIATTIASIISGLFRRQ